MKYILLLPLFLACSVMAQEPDSSSAIFSMREAERNFARASLMFGRNSAFVENFAEESVIFTDRWITSGKQFWKDLKASPVVLKWEPEFMDISESRDFGISTGPWESQEYRPNTEPLSTGYYLTVWKKESNGIWKVILDAGSTTPANKSYAHQFSFPFGADRTIPDPPVMNTELVRQELMDREKQILSEWEKDHLNSTYSSFLAPNAIIERKGHLPTSNADTINFLIGKLNRKLVWKTVGAGAASSGDLGFTYGILEYQEPSASGKGHYVRIWRKRSGASWNIVLEMISTD
jgi:ketosteroid isomerase-like protein